jgi:hypothetical protein
MWWAWDGYTRDQEAKESLVPLLEEWGILLTPEQKKKLLKAKIAVALQDELGRVPKEAKINQVFLLTRVMYKVA